MFDSVINSNHLDNRLTHECVMNNMHELFVGSSWYTFLKLLATSFQSRSVKRAVKFYAICDIVKFLFASHYFRYAYPLHKCLDRNYVNKKALSRYAKYGEMLN